MPVHRELPLAEWLNMGYIRLKDPSLLPLGGIWGHLGVTGGRAVAPEQFRPPRPSTVKKIRVWRGHRAPPWGVTWGPGGQRSPLWGATWGPGGQRAPPRGPPGGRLGAREHHREGQPGGQRAPPRRATWGPLMARFQRRVRLGRLGTRSPFGRQLEFALRKQFFLLTLLREPISKLAFPPGALAYRVILTRPVDHASCAEENDSSFPRPTCNLWWSLVWQ